MNKPSFTISNNMLNRSISIAEKISQLSVYRLLEKMPILRKNNTIRSIYSSLAIEANTLSIDQVRDVIGGKNVIGKKNDIQEVLNAYKAYEMIDDFDPFNEKDLLKTDWLR